VYRAAPSRKEVLSYPMSENHKWYVIHVYSGFESKIVESIMEQAEKKGIEDQFSELLVPAEEVVEVRRGKKYNAERKFFPGYILAKMELSDAAWNLVKNTQRVTGFLGGQGRPVPISEREAKQIMQSMQEGAEKPRPSITYEVGENVRVTDGAFTSFSGVVEEVDLEKARLKVAVSIFGRATPVELDYSQVEKA
jgi:transcriptional antiterminator NusG